MEKNNPLIHSAFLILAIDVNIEQQEIDTLTSDPYWDKHFFTGCDTEFLSLLEEGKVLEVCKRSIENEIVSEQDKIDFTFALLRLVMSDGKAEDSELTLLFTLASFADINSERVSSLIDEWINSQRITVDNKLILSAFLMCSSDGDFDNKEVKTISADPYWEKLFYEGCAEEFIALNFDDLKAICAAEAVKHISTEHDKIEYIDALLRLIVSDGVVNENEVFLLNILVEPLGITPTQLTGIIKGFNNRRSGSNPTTNRTTEKVQNSGCAGIAVVTLFLATVLASLIVL